jgi:hypothetical protein
LDHRLHPRSGLGPGPGNAPTPDRLMMPDIFMFW